MEGAVSHIEVFALKASSLFGLLLVINVWFNGPRL